MEDDLTSKIHARYQRILEKIAQASARSRYASETVHVVVVSKSQTMEVVRAAVSAGISVFGENYVDEAVEKIATLAQSGVEWHMIGHVQSRKAEQVAKNFSMVHSLENVKLAGRLDRFCTELNLTLPLLLEFNVSGEESKYGFPAWDEKRWPELLPEIERIISLPHLQVSGLMTMPPYFDDSEKARPYFRMLRRLREFLQQRFPQAEWSELSMGTSVDFIAAIEEGATYVRIGEAILGPRRI
jgi:hypothetical protein